MADTVRKYFPFLFERWPEVICRSFQCLEIVECNSNCSWPFTNVNLHVRGFENPERRCSDRVLCVSDRYLYRGVMYDMVCNRNMGKEAKDKAVESLGEFLENDQHRQCLESMANQPSKSEALVQSVLALHLFQPLCGDSKVIADDRNYQHSDTPRECPFCGATVNTGDTSFGNRHIWYGYGDIQLERSFVKIECTRDSSSKAECETGIREESDAGLTVESDTEEPECKLIRLESNGSEWIDSDTSDDSYMPKGPGRIKYNSCTGHPSLSHVLSQTIVNAFLQVKEHPALEGSFIPGFLASDYFLTVHMYNPTDDVLLTQQRAMPIWKNSQPSQGFNFDTILSLWIALNMHKFSRCFPCESEKLGLESGLFKVSSFHEKTKASLNLYQTELKRPLDKAVCEPDDDLTEGDLDLSNHLLSEIIKKYQGQVGQN